MMFKNYFSKINTAIIIVVFIFGSLCLILPAQADIGYLLCNGNGNIIAEKNANQKFVPASILKILTALTAIKEFGNTYRFPTGYYFDPESKNLYIKGFGDPLFISEVIGDFAKQVKKKCQFNSIHQIIIDQTFYSTDIQIPGLGDSLNPYDASVYPLCANFNTVLFKRLSSGKIDSAEPQTPLISHIVDEIRKTGIKTGRITLSPEKSKLYAGQLLKFFLKRDGVNVSGKVAIGRMPKIEKKNYAVYYSPYPLEDAVKKLLKYSNNFIANQLLLSLGAKNYSTPATLKHGVKALKQFAAQQLQLPNLILTEGSGISRNNRISPAQMIKILLAFKPYLRLMREDGIDHYKTGTLSQVRTRAGYFIGNNRIPHPYVIMTSGQDINYHGVYNTLKKIALRS